MHRSAFGPNLLNKYLNSLTDILQYKVRLFVNGTAVYLAVNNT